MKKVLITAPKNFTHGGIMFGRDGEYEVSDAVAKEMVNSKKAKIVQNISEDPREAKTYEEIQSGVNFLAMVREHALEIADIINDAVSADFNDKVLVNAEKASTMNASPESNKDDEADTSNASIDKTDESVDENSDKTESEEDKDKTLLPERFPGKQHLEDAGIKFIEDIPDTKEALLEIPNITERAAVSIAAKLAQG